ncbi:bll3089 protein [Gracilibacillus boraciitolerans JCM 21714]|uniref:Bll3089 protein n=1 Tax=Gracilibacillus boraciitolerans JCM 21714 TaxID=1298598 RepID=W4VG61_9BACI|nr:bll3089 protein [Gracilibacillus boraciitolerans JCM 21714]
MLFPILNTWLIETWDWQFAWRFWGVLLLIVFVPIAFFGVRNRPEDVGLVPDGLVKISDKKKNDTFKPVREENWKLNEALKTRAFWMILICIGFPPSLVNTGITFHIISIFAFHDLQAGIAATVLSLMAVVGMPMSLLSGFITEKIKTNYLFFIIFILELFILLLLLVLANIYIAVLVGVIWGGCKRFWPYCNKCDLAGLFWSQVYRQYKWCRCYGNGSRISVWSLTIWCGI